MTTDTSSNDELKKFFLQNWLRIVVVLLVASASWVVFSSHYDAKTHHRVPNYPVRFGLDINGGVRAILQAQTSNLPPGVVYDGDTVRRILENRIDANGVAAATVQRKGTDQFIIELPDVKNKNEILQRLGTTAQMTFYYFKDVACRRDQNRPIQMNVQDDASGNETYSFTDRRTNRTFHDESYIEAQFTALLAQGTAPRPGAEAFTVAAPLSAELPDNSPVYFTPAQQQQAEELNQELQDWNAFIEDSPIILTGADIKPQSVAHLGGQFGNLPAVEQFFNDKGQQEFATFTTDHVDEINGIVLDGKVLSAPIINEPITEGEAEISGGFKSLQVAQDLANMLNAGALPVPLKQVETESVEASLGADAVHKSIIAGLVGLSLVLIFMLAYYRLPGLVADIALLIYTLFAFAIYRGGLQWLGAGLSAITLTLPGIAGFILSIGMAVDANILIFERMREELRNGRPIRAAIDIGFKRAITAIRDSNICTCITCVILLTLGTPAVKGFAVTLLIGVLVSLFTAITVTRTLLFVLVDAGLTRNHDFFAPKSFFDREAAAAAAQKDRNIIGRRNFFYLLSLAIIVPGLIFFFLGGLHEGIDFTGGSQIEVQYPNVVRAGDVVSSVASVKQKGFEKPNVQMAEGGKVAIVTVKAISPVGNPDLNPVYQGLMTGLTKLGPAHEIRFSNVGGTISAELTRNAVQAVAVASGLIVLYLAVVFAIGGFIAGLRLGLAAVAALIHDVLVLGGSFSILGYFLGWEIDSMFVVAMLTVIGFSVHDTVVIFDRVRENLRHKARGEAFEPLVNRSINQTLTRSIFTSMTVLMTLLALIIFGGQTTRQLNFALFIGILSGTYSSIFNAAAILVDWENWLARRAASRPRIAASGPTAAIAGGGTIRPPSAPRSSQGTADLESAGPSIKATKVKKKKAGRRF